MLEIHETYVNETKGYRFGESDWYEPFTDNRVRLFRDMQREYGGCIGKVYRDVATHVAQVPNCPMVARPDRVTWEVIACGWVFAKRMAYEDARGNPYTGRLDPERDFYRREVWVELRETPDPDPDQD